MQQMVRVSLLSAGLVGMYTYVTWQGIDYELPEDDTIVSKHVEAA
jgi:hypothetical protein